MIKAFVGDYSFWGRITALVLESLQRRALRRYSDQSIDIRILIELSSKFQRSNGLDLFLALRWNIERLNSEFWDF